MLSVSKCGAVVWFTSISYSLVALLVLLVLASPGGDTWFTKQAVNDPESVDRCFCQLKGLIDDCSCSVESIDNFNNVHVYPLLNSLLNRDFFRYWKVNLQKNCPFWADDSRCSIRFCSVEECTEVPLGISEKYLLEDCSAEERLGYLNTTLSEASRAGFEVWAAHDSAQDDSFCEPEDDSSPGSAYVDLLANPERYTGYQGPSAHRLWRTIYQENCFSGSSSERSLPFPAITDAQAELCLEKRTFYRAISGLHSSINVHLSAQYLLQDGSEGFGAARPSVWGHNAEEFRKRFDPALTDGEGPTRLKNLYFLYLMELRALAKAGPQLELLHYFTGNTEEDRDVRQAVSALVRVARSFQHFDESTYFSNGQANLKEEFRQHFRNVTRIMDCVGCDKCKLWGKLQVTGLGTALKILFSGNFDEVVLGPKEQQEAARPVQQPRLQLTRSEVVALVNAFGRLSRSILELEQFRKMAQS